MPTPDIPPPPGGPRLDQAIEDLEFLNQVATVVARAETPAAAEQAIITTCVERLKAEQGAIWRMSTAELSPLATVARVFEGGIPGLPLRLNLQILDWIQRNQAPLLSNDIVNDPRLKHGPQGAPQGLKSLLAVPLFHKKMIIGLLAVLNAREAQGFTEADQRALAIIGMQCAQLQENARLQAEEVRLRELEKELAAARQIQQSLLPAIMPVVAGWEFAGHYEPARQVGGDLYHVDRVGERVHLAVADVAGKGLPASLYMVNVCSNMRALAASGLAPAELMLRLNEVLLATLTEGRFVTLFWGTLDVSSGLYRYCNGGHNAALLVHADGAHEWLDAGGTLIGLIPGLAFDDGEKILNPGDRLVLYSDGITEAMAPDGDFFGDDRLVEAVRGAMTGDQKNAGQIVKAVLDAVLHHESGGPAMDDKTILVVARG